MSHTRRQLLQRLSVGGASLAMSPFMRSLQVHAAGNEALLPRRFVFVIKSSGIDKHNLVPEGLDNHFLDGKGKLGYRVPKPGGDINVSLKNLKLPEKLAPLEPFKHRTTILQSLSGETFRGNHTSGYGMLSCHNSERVAIAPTIDCILGQHLSTGPYPMYGLATSDRLLEAGAWVPADNYCYPNVSAYQKGMPVAFQGSPLKAHADLFGAGVAPPEEVKKTLALNGSMMDFLKDDARRIERQLSGDDKERFALYTQSFDAIRNIEMKKAKLSAEAKKHAPTLTDYYKSQVPSERIASHFEIGTAALITGMTNVVTLHLDNLAVVYRELGIQKHVHALGHNDPGLSGDGWDGVRCRTEVEKSHFKHIANMASKFDSIPEGNGSMLDNTLIVYVSCSGGDHHDGQLDWPFVLVGGMANKLNMGRYIEYPKYKDAGHRTISNLYLSLMHAAGMNAPKTFGQLDGSLRHLDLTGPLEELMVG
ncbi:MAG: hypothetical protein ACI9TH_003777 [Kiritimatiellia bacterium]|jgi:hypothetical protein